MTKPLTVIQNSIPKVESLEILVSDLEDLGGNLAKFLLNYPAGERILFQIEKLLEQPENAAFKQRWQNALKISAKIRMDMLRCKAFDTLEAYENRSTTSSAPDISFAKTILIGILVEDSEMVKSRYRPIMTPVMAMQQEKETDEIDELEDKFDAAEAG